MSPSSLPSVARTTFLSASLSLSVFSVTLASAPSPTYAQDGAASAASTITSKEKVTFIIDRDQSGPQSFVLVKIMVPADAKASTLMLADPPRLVVDFTGLALKKSENLQPPKNGAVKQIRLGAHPDKLRVVLDLIGDTPPQYEFKAGARQAILRIVEGSGAQPAAPVAAPQQSPTTVPSTPTPKTVVATPIPATPTSVPATPTKIPATPAIVAPTATPTKPPAHTATTIPTAPPVATAPSATTSQTNPAPKLPAITEEEAGITLGESADEKEIEAALEQEVANASKSIALGTPIQEEEEAVETDDSENASTEEDSAADADTAPEIPAKTSTTIVEKTLAAATPAVAAANAVAEPAKGLRPNAVPTAPITSFMVEKATFDTLEPGHQQAFRVRMTQPGAQAQVSKVDATTYKIVISSCGLESLGLALPQYPPSDFTGLGMVSVKSIGDTVEITAHVQPGTSLITLMRDKDLWITKQ